MTRINLVPPSELSDQHLFAEWREIKMVPKSLKRSLRTKTWLKIKQEIPKSFTLNQGHVKFFFDKMLYLQNRFASLTDELERRRYNFNKDSFLDLSDLPLESFGDYNPDEIAFDIIRKRIQEKINMKPDWYRWTSSITAMA